MIPDHLSSRLATGTPPYTAPLIPQIHSRGCTPGRVVWLTFSVKPDIVDTGGDVIVVEGRRLTLSCRVQTGSPRASVTWYVDGSPAADARRAVLVDPASRTLVVASTTHGDAGRYTCVAANTAGSDVTHFDVHVVGLSPFHACDVRTKIRRHIRTRNTQNKNILQNFRPVGRPS